MKITVWTVTTDGDNCPLTTSVHASEQAALAYVAGELGLEPGLGHDDLVAAWEAENDGACCIEEHALDFADECPSCGRSLPRVCAVCGHDYRSEPGNTPTDRALDAVHALSRPEGGRTC